MSCGLFSYSDQVITKTARLPDVCEFVMNEAEFERRAETNSTMFRDKITRRNPGKSKKGVRGAYQVFSFYDMFKNTSYLPPLRNVFLDSMLTGRVARIFFLQERQPRCIRDVT